MICAHQLNSADPIGFVENSSDPDDLQAWCYACEYLYAQEGDWTQNSKSSITQGSSVRSVTKNIERCIPLTSKHYDRRNKARSPGALNA
jgi:hypothetical protein